MICSLSELSSRKHILKVLTDIPKNQYVCLLSVKSDF